MVGEVCFLPVGEQFANVVLVGVVGSGKGMTEHLGRVKHKFEKGKTLDEE